MPTSPNELLDEPSDRDPATGALLAVRGGELVAGTPLVAPTRPAPGASWPNRGEPVSVT